MGSGFRTFATQEVLTAANVNNYLMEQAVMSFATSTARDAAVTSPEEGMTAYLQDTNSITVYSGSAWVTIADLDVLIVSSVGRVGINTTPAAELDIHGASNPEVRIQSTDSSDPFLYFGDQVDAVRGGIGYDVSEDALLLRGYNNNTRMAIDSSGNVGIGTETPNGRLHVYDGADLLYTQAVTGLQNLFLPVVYARTTTSAGTSQNLASNGQFRRSTSAAKYKKDIEDIDIDRAEVVYDLRPVWYRSAIETDRPDHSYYGFIADEVVDLEPRLVQFDEQTGEVEGFFYQMLTAHLVKIAQMQKAAIDDLTARIEALENQ